MKTGQKLGAALILVLTASAALMAQTATPPTQSFGATVYLDYRYYLSSAGPLTLKPTDPTVPYINNQFVFRRAYFTYENKINDFLTFRFRLDADNTANVTGVSLTGTPVSGVSLSKDDKLRPFLKHLYVQWSNFLLPDWTLRVGMEETLTFKIAEDKWGYRSVAKTITDGFKDITGTDIRATSADIGVSLQGSPVKFLRYGLQVVNGAGYSHLANDAYKKFEGNLQVIPLAGLSVVGYMDIERQQYKANPLALTQPMAYTYKIDGFFEMVKGLLVGGEWFSYRNDLNQAVNPVTEAQEKYNVTGWSVFGHYTLVQDKLNAFARYDSYEPNSLNRAKDVDLAILGLDWAPLHSSLKLQPNIWIYNYKNGTLYNSHATSNSDIVFNMTFFLSF
jgi:hypothetical protein